MINTLIAFADEDRALMELEPFGYAHIVAPPEGETGGEVVYAWNQGTAMVGGAGIILSYKQQTVPGPAARTSPSTCRRSRRASGCRCCRKSLTKSCGSR